MFHSVKLVREQKEEYMDHLFDVLYESTYKVFKMIYYPVMNEKELLKAFQKELARIPEWNQLKVESVYNELITASKCNYFPELLKTIYVLSIKMVLLGVPAENRSKIKIKVPDAPTFYHRLLIHVARDVWKRPYLFYHKVKSIEQQNHLYQFETIIRRKIRSVIRDTIPMELMVQQLSNSDILREAEDSSSESEASESSASEAEEDDESEASENEVEKDETNESSESEEDDESEASENEVEKDETNESSESEEADEADASKAEENEVMEDDDLLAKDSSSASSVSENNEAEPMMEKPDTDVSFDEPEVKAEDDEEPIPEIKEGSSTLIPEIPVTIYEEPKKKLIHIQELMKHKKKHKSKDRFF